MQAPTLMNDASYWFLYFQLDRRTLDCPRGTEFAYLRIEERLACWGTLRKERFQDDVNAFSTGAAA